MTVLAVGLGIACFAAGFLLGLPLSEGFLFAVGVTVALVPEGLLPTVTLSLARSAQLLARDHALVRRLESVETLGSTTFICTDKTGTLTQNRMAVVEVWSPQGTVRVQGVGYEPTGEVTGDPEAVRAVRDAARAAVVCSTGRIHDTAAGWEAVGDPMEAALDALARRLELPGTHAGRAPGHAAGSPSTPADAACRCGPTASCTSRARPTASSRAASTAREPPEAAADMAAAGTAGPRRRPAAGPPGRGRRRR